MYAKHFSTIVALLLALMVLALPAQAQSTSRSAYGINGGLGIAHSPNNPLLVSLAGSLERRVGPAFLSLRGTTSAMVLGDGLTDVGLLAGFAIGDGSAGRVALSAGPALTIMDRVRPNRFLGMGEEEGVKRVTESLPGLALGARLSLLETDLGRVAIYGFANVNREENFGGVALNVGLFF